MTIRPAVAADVPWLVDQLRSFAAFFGTRLSLFPEDPAQAAGVVGALVLRGPFFIAEDTSGAPVGFIAGVLDAHPFNPGITVLTELFWWVRPAARGSSAGARLLEAFTAFGRAHADWIVMALEAQSPVHPETLERRGYQPRERSFLMEVER
jgi:hypothetical protein